MTGPPAPDARGHDEEADEALLAEIRRALGPEDRPPEALVQSVKDAFAERRRRAKPRQPSR
jgi:hypothetical protein